MKLPRLITRRRAKWAGLIITGSVIIVAVGSVFLKFTHIWVTQESEYVVRVAGGSIHVARIQRRPDKPNRVDGFLETGLTANDDQRMTMTWWLRYRTTPGVLWTLQIPLWLPLLLIAVPTGWLWRTDRRAKPWQCAKCRYDLRGLEGGVCPECGLAIGEG